MAPMQFVIREDTRRYDLKSNYGSEGSRFNSWWVHHLEGTASRNRKYWNETVVLVFFAGLICNRTR
jgi:hypothetical protein